MTSENTPFHPTVISSKEPGGVDREARPFLLVVVVAMSILLVCYALLFGNSGMPDRITLGQFGDYFGGILNPVIAVCALYALWRSIRIQKIELSETRESIKKQQFESAVFSLIDLIKRTVSDIHLYRPEIEIGGSYVAETESGEQALSFLKKYYVGKYLNDARDSSIPANPNERDEGLSLLASSNYSDLYARAEPYLGHLFRSTYQTLKYIARNCPEENDERRFYVNLVRASISSNGFFLLGLNAVFGEYGGNFRLEPIKSLDFFENMFDKLNRADPNEKWLAERLCKTLYFP